MGFSMNLFKLIMRDSHSLFGCDTSQHYCQFQGRHAPQTFFLNFVGVLRNIGLDSLPWIGAPPRGSTRCSPENNSTSGSNNLTLQESQFLKKNREKFDLCKSIKAHLTFPKIVFFVEQLPLTLGWAPVSSYMICLPLHNDVELSYFFLFIAWHLILTKKSSTEGNTLLTML